MKVAFVGTIDVDHADDYQVLESITEAIESDAAFEGNETLALTEAPLEQVMKLQKRRKIEDEIVEGVILGHHDDPELEASLRWIVDDEVLLAFFEIGRGLSFIGEHHVSVDSNGLEKTGRVGVAFDGGAALIFVPDDKSPIWQFVPIADVGHQWMETGWYFKQGQV